MECSQCGALRSVLRASHCVTAATAPVFLSTPLSNVYTPPPQTLSPSIGGLARVQDCAPMSAGNYLLVSKETISGPGGEVDGTVPSLSVRATV